MYIKVFTHIVNHHYTNNKSNKTKKPDEYVYCT